MGEEVSVEIEQGKTLHIQLLGVGNVNDRGEREIFYRINGQMRTLNLLDKKAAKVGDLCLLGEVMLPK